MQHDDRLHLRKSEIYAQVHDLPPDAMRRRLAELTDDDELRAAVLEQYRYDQRSTDFLGEPAVPPPGQWLDPPPPGTRIGGFVLGPRLGRGGAGYVYRATAGDGRTVALKLLHAGDGAAWERRLRKEIEALGRLDHAGVARFVDTGTYADELGQARPWIAMEFVDGERLDHFLARTQPSEPERLRLLAGIADAVQHAHDQGVLHRDLKPANVLVTPGGAPVVLDFGIARVEGSELTTLLTATGQMLGTIGYMSPEQVQGRREQIGPASDVYSLAVVAYEALAGSRPCQPDALTVGSAVRVITEVDPPPLRQVAPAAGAAAEAMLAVALQKDPRHRHRSMSAFAADLRAAADGRPVWARAPGPLRRTWRRWKRKPSRVALAALAAVVLAGVALGLWREHRLSQQRQRDAQLARADELLASDPDAAIPHLLAAADLADGPDVRTRLAAALDGFRQQAVIHRGKPWIAMALSPRGDLLALVDEDGDGTFLTTDGDVVGSFPGGEALAFSPDGARLAVVGRLDVPASTLLRTGDRVGWIVSADGRGEPVPLVWENVPTRRSKQPVAAHACWATPDRLVVAAQGDPSLLFDAAGARVASLGEAGVVVHSLVALSDGCLATGDSDGVVRVFRAEDGDLIAASEPLPGVVTALVEAHGGKLAAVAAERLHVLTLEAGRLTAQRTGEQPVSAPLVGSPDGAALAVRSGERIEIRDVADGGLLGPGVDASSVAPATIPVTGVRWSAAGLLAVHGRHGRILLADASHGAAQRPLRLDGLVCDVAFSPAGELLFAAATDGTVRRFDGRPPRKVFDPDTEDLVTTPLFASTGGRRVLVTTRSRAQALLVDRTTGTVAASIGLSSPGAERVAVEPGGRRVAAWGPPARPGPGQVEIVDVDAPGEGVAVPCHGFVLDLAFHPQDGRLAVLTDGGLLLVDPDHPGRLSRPVGDEARPPTRFAWSLEGDVLALATMDGRVLLCDVDATPAGIRVLQLPAAPTALAFLPGGTLLVGDERGRVQRVSTGEAAPAPVEIGCAPGAVLKLVAPRSGRVAVAVSPEGVVALPLSGAAEGAPALPVAAASASVALDADGEHVLVLHEDRVLRRWRFDGSDAEALPGRFAGAVVAPARDDQLVMLSTPAPRMELRDGEGRSLRVLPEIERVGYGDADGSLDGEVVALVDRDVRVLLLGPDGDVQRLAPLDARYTGVDVRLDGRQVLAWTSQALHVFDGHGRPSHVVPIEGAYVEYAALSDDGEHVLLCSSTGRPPTLLYTTELRDAVSGEVITTFELEAQVIRARFVAGTSFVALGHALGGEGWGLFDVRTGRRLDGWSGERLLHLASSPSGGALLSWPKNGIAALRRVPDAPLRLDLPRASVVDAAFAPDGVVLVGADGVRSEHAGDPAAAARAAGLLPAAIAGR